VPEQEFLPPRRPARFHRPGPDGRYGHQDEDPPPWAGLPPVRPARPGADYPMGSWQTPGPAGPPPPPGPAGPRQDGPVPQWAGPDALSSGSGAEDEAPPRDRPRAPGGRAPGGRAPGGRAPGGRALRAAARRRRRWLIMIAGLVVVAGGVTAAVVIPGGPPPAPVVPGGLITTFQPGELQTVPNACGTVPAATVQQYLPGQPKQTSPLAIDGAAESACNWTIDHAPVYRLLQLNLLAYAPSGLASGDGSATNAAIDAYAQTQRYLRDPPRHSAETRAAIIALSGLGNEAFSATQVFRAGGAVTDVATVVVRFHNVIVQATLDGLEHSNRGDYGPVSMPDLSAAALAFAQAAEAALH
jgi:hypothetical protein